MTSIIYELRSPTTPLEEKLALANTVSTAAECKLVGDWIAGELFPKQKTHAIEHPAWWAAFARLDSLSKGSVSFLSSRVVYQGSTLAVSNNDLAPAVLSAVASRHLDEVVKVSSIDANLSAFKTILSSFANLDSPSESQESLVSLWASVMARDSHSAKRYESAIVLLSPLSDIVTKNTHVTSHLFSCFCTMYFSADALRKSLAKVSYNQADSLDISADISSHLRAHAPLTAAPVLGFILPLFVSIIDSYGDGILFKSSSLDTRELQLMLITDFIATAFDLCDSNIFNRVLHVLADRHLLRSSRTQQGLKYTQVLQRIACYASNQLVRQINKPNNDLVDVSVNVDTLVLLLDYNPDIVCDGPVRQDCLSAFASLPSNHVLPLGNAFVSHSVKVRQVSELFDGFVMAASSHTTSESAILFSDTFHASVSQILKLDTVIADHSDLILSIAHKISSQPLYLLALSFALSAYNCNESTIQPLTRVITEHIFPALFETSPIQTQVRCDALLAIYTLFESNGWDHALSFPTSDFVSRVKKGSPRDAILFARSVPFSCWTSEFGTALLKRASKIHNTPWDGHLDSVAEEPHLTAALWSLACFKYLPFIDRDDKNASRFANILLRTLSFQDPSQVSGDDFSPLSVSLRLIDNYTFIEQKNIRSALQHSLSDMVADKDNSATSAVPHALTLRADYLGPVFTLVVHDCIAQIKKHPEIVILLAKSIAMENSLPAETLKSDVWPKVLAKIIVFEDPLIARLLQRIFMANDQPTLLKSVEKITKKAESLDDLFPISRLLDAWSLVAVAKEFHDVWKKVALKAASFVPHAASRIAQGSSSIAGVVSLHGGLVKSGHATQASRGLLSAALIKSLSGEISGAADDFVKLLGWGLEKAVKSKQDPSEPYVEPLVHSWAVDLAYLLLIQEDSITDSAIATVSWTTEGIASLLNILTSRITKGPSVIANEVAVVSRLINAVPITFSVREFTTTAFGLLSWILQDQPVSKQHTRYTHFLKTIAGRYALNVYFMDRLRIAGLLGLVCAFTLHTDSKYITNEDASHMYDDLIDIVSLCVQHCKEQLAEILPLLLFTVGRLIAILRRGNEAHETLGSGSSYMHRLGQLGGTSKQVTLHSTEGLPAWVLTQGNFITERHAQKVGRIIRDLCVRTNTATGATFSLRAPLDKVGPVLFFFVQDHTTHPTMPLARETRIPIMQALVELWDLFSQSSRDVVMAHAKSNDSARLLFQAMHGDWAQTKYKG